MENKIKIARVCISLLVAGSLILYADFLPSVKIQLGKQANIFTKTNKPTNIIFSFSSEIIIRTELNIFYKRFYSKHITF